MTSPNVNLQLVSTSMVDAQPMIRLIEDVSSSLCTNSLMSSRDLSQETKFLVDRYGKILRQTENDEEAWLKVQDLVHVYDLEKDSISTSLETVETFLQQAELTEWNSANVNARLNENQVSPFV